MTKTTPTAAALVEAGLSAESAAAAADAIAWGRAETEPCERGTVGCSVRHTTDSECATW